MSKYKVARKRKEGLHIMFLRVNSASKTLPL